MFICSTVSRLQYHFQPPAPAPHAIFMQKDSNGEHYLTSTTHQNPLYVPPPSNSCQSSPQAQQQFHLIRLQNNPPPVQNNELRSNNQSMHIKQLHTATVHGKLHIHTAVIFTANREICPFPLFGWKLYLWFRNFIVIVTHFETDCDIMKLYLMVVFFMWFSFSFFSLFPSSLSSSYYMNFARPGNVLPSINGTYTNTWTGQGWVEASFCRSHYHKK